MGRAIVRLCPEGFIRPIPMWRTLMKKTLITCATVLALIVPSVSFAQEKAPEGAAREHHRLSEADLKAFTDARVAALKAGLALTPDQEKNWAPVEQDIRNMAQARQASSAAGREHKETGE